MRTFGAFAILCFAVSVTAQNSVSDLAANHATALENYLSTNKTLTFRQEHNLSDEYLKSVREWFGRTFKPNYAVGDFNRDKIPDFAVLLYREGKPEPNVESNEISEHTPDYPLRLVVFNGENRGFRVAYTFDLMGPHAAFIRFEKKLYYGIFETDSDTFILAPAGRGYIMEFEKPR
ncbi:MAG: hypothetical protein JSS77_06770 [Acidobacteria bacterium]|nr:hypothetical protein [Acidobacteriota bacterium]